MNAQEQQLFLQSIGLNQQREALVTKQSQHEQLIAELREIPQNVPMVLRGDEKKPTVLAFNTPMDGRAATSTTAVYFCLEPGQVIRVGIYNNFLESNIDEVRQFTSTEIQNSRADLRQALTSLRPLAI